MINGVFQEFRTGQTVEVSILRDNETINRENEAGEKLIERYTLPEMGGIWKDQFKFNTWLQIEILACEARAGMGEST